MPVVEIRKDPKTLTMTVTAQFAAPVARVWAAYADPRQLERFWGPPEWPAKFERHDFTVGGRSEYVMTGPNGEHVTRLLGVPEHRPASGVRGEGRLPRAGRQAGAGHADDADAFHLRAARRWHAHGDGDDVPLA